MQSVLVVIIVTVAVLMVGRQAFRTLTGRKSGCACDETKCPLVNSEPTTSAESTCRLCDDR